MEKRAAQSVKMKGIKTVGSGGLHRIWPYTTNMVLRTHKSVVESVRKVIQSGKPVSFDHPVYS